MNFDSPVSRKRQTPSLLTQERDAVARLREIVNFEN